VSSAALCTTLMCEKPLASTINTPTDVAKNARTIVPVRLGRATGARIIESQWDGCTLFSRLVDEPGKDRIINDNTRESLPLSCLFPADVHILSLVREQDRCEVLPQRIDAAALQGRQRSISVRTVEMSRRFSRRRASRDADTFGMFTALNVASQTLTDEPEPRRTTPGHRTGSRAGASILPGRLGQPADVGGVQA